MNKRGAAAMQRPFFMATASQRVATAPTALSQAAMFRGGVSFQESTARRACRDAGRDVLRMAFGPAQLAHPAAKRDQPLGRALQRAHRLVLHQRRSAAREGRIGRRHRRVEVGAEHLIELADFQRDRHAVLAGRHLVRVRPGGQQNGWNIFSRDVQIGQWHGRRRPDPGRGRRRATGQRDQHSQHNRRGNGGELAWEAPTMRGHGWTISERKGVQLYRVRRSPPARTSIVRSKMNDNCQIRSHT
jgi:hypothetical protein